MIAAAALSRSDSRWKERVLPLDLDQLVPCDCARHDRHLRRRDVGPPRHGADHGLVCPPIGRRLADPQLKRQAVPLQALQLWVRDDLLEAQARRRRLRRGGLAVVTLLLVVLVGLVPGPGRQQGTGVGRTGAVTATRAPVGSRAAALTLARQMLAPARRTARVTGCPSVAGAAAAQCVIGRRHLAVHR